MKIFKIKYNFRNQICGLLIFTLGIFLFSNKVQGQNINNENLKSEMKEDEELAARVKSKLFPGGKDEGEIVVLPELPKPKKKFKDDKGNELEPASADD